MCTTAPRSSETRRPTPGLDRLRRAVEAMDLANTELASNTRMFRESIGELKSELTTLRDTTVGYHDALGRIDVTPLRAELLRLADIADEWAGNDGPAGCRAA